MSTQPIEAGQQMRVIMLDKPGGKRTGQTRPVKLLLLLCDKGKLRPGKSILVETTDYPCSHSLYRQCWVDPKYLLPIESETTE